MMPLLRDTIVEVNLDNIAFNIKSIKDMVGRDVAIAAVIKANGYGHGAVGIAKELIENGVDCLAVATLNEAMELRRNFKDYNIFILGYTPDEYLEYIVKNDITQTIFSYRQAKILEKLGRIYNKKPIVHIKYDTGFNRLGFRDCKESIDEIEKICRLKNIYVEGIFSHYKVVIEDSSFWLCLRLLYQILL